MNASDLARLKALASPLIAKASSRAQKTALKGFRSSRLGKFASAIRGIQRASTKPTKQINTLAKSVAQFVGQSYKPRAKPMTQAEAMKFVKGSFLSWLEQRALNALLKRLGPLGKAMAEIAKQAGKKSPAGLQSELDAATSLLKAFGYEVKAPTVFAPPGAKPPRKPPGPASKGISIEPEAPPSQQPTGQKPKVAFPPKLQPQLVESPVGDVGPKPLTMTRTPNSSNVWAYGYDESSSTMYVQFQAPLLNTAAIKGTPLATFPGGKGKRPRGKLGKTVVGKVNKPGPLYAYYNVPKSVYRKFQRASSAGGAVWDNLRIRGSAYGHQFPYGLVHGVATQGVDYVPRRASEGAMGYVQRHIETAEGRRLVSLLPTERGIFGTTDRGMASAMPDRGRPNRGRN